jgi:hypothetical protein
VSQPRAGSHRSSRQNGLVSETRSGYRSSFAGLVGALLASLAVVGVFFLGTVLNQQDDSTPPTQDYTAELAVARAEAPFRVLAPEPAPSGWRATSSEYVGAGPEKSWHLGFLTDDGKYVGLEQGNAVPQAFVQDKTPADQPGPPLQIDGKHWQTLTGDHETALVLFGQDVTTVVTGTAPESELIVFARSLRAP